MKSLLIGATAAVFCVGFTVAEYRPDEQIVLMDCGFAANGDSKYHKLAYYPGKAYDGNHNLKTPEMLADVPWDGSYPWRNALSVYTPNGDQFDIGIDPSVPDITSPPYKWAGFGRNKFGQKGFACYSWHERQAYFLQDGTECGTAFICLHVKSDSDDGGIKGGSNSGGSNQPKPKYERSTTITLSSDAILVDGSSSGDDFGLVDPKDAFHQVHNSLQGNMCKSSWVSISKKCQMRFDCSFGGKEGDAEVRAKALAKLLDGTAGPEITKTEHKWTTYSNQWGVPTYHKSYKYPRNGKILVSVWDKGSPDTATIQSELKFEVECNSGNWFCDKTCGTLATTMVAVGYHSELAPVGIFGTVAAGACGVLC